MTGGMKFCPDRRRWAEVEMSGPPVISAADSGERASIHVLKVGVM